MKDIEILSNLFQEYFGVAPVNVSRMSGAGSGRRYYRLSGPGAQIGANGSCIGVAGDSLRDSMAFLRLGEIFKKNDIPVPEVYVVDTDPNYYLQQDLGDVSLFDIIRREGMSERVERLTMLAMRGLARLQEIPEKEWYSIVEYRPFGSRQVMWDLNYFKYEYLRPSGIVFDEERLEDEFERLSETLVADAELTEGFMYRDCQSRNVMICDDHPWWIDYQGGRKGPGIYDAVSFLWQAKAGFSKEFRCRMLDVYRREKFDLTRRKVYSGEKDFLRYVDIWVLFRTLQVLGAYGLRGLVERKAHFIESIPGALTNLEALVDAGVVDGYPELKRVCKAVCADERFQALTHTGLCVEIFSFSYKKGYPADYSGNGGGFMFDCRGMHNPGRYPEYRSLTGRDKAVVDFLEGKGEVQTFVENALAIVGPSVLTYIRRGFSKLQVGFGCTGGQHRSVYCADRMARILKEKFPDIEVKLVHREQSLIN